MPGSNPWRHIDTPPSAYTINARRVDASLRWDFFWARASDRRVMLTLRHAASSSPEAKLPRIRGIEASLSPIDTHGHRTLGLKLKDSSHQDIFYTLCTDIVQAARDAASERDAVSIALRRTWRWHHLLRGGRSGLLTHEEQKGLIGELLVLKRYLLPRLPISDAISTWLGPFGAPKDFEVGNLAIEAKARRGTARPFIAIASEYQLDSDGVDALFLHVVDLSVALQGSSGSFSVSQLIASIRDCILSDDPGVADAFDVVLTAAGFREEDDYSDSQWVEGRSRVYAVGPGFPRITTSSTPAGVEQVNYSIGLGRCKPFEVPMSRLGDAIAAMREHDAN